MGVELGYLHLILSKTIEFMSIEIVPSISFFWVFIWASVVYVVWRLL